MSRPAYLLDTNILVALARGGDAARRIDRAYGIRAPGPTPLVCVVSEAELKVLADRNAWGEKRIAQIDAMFEELVVIDIGAPEVIEAYVALARAARGAKKGARQLSHNDLWIASATVAAGATLITTDGDFEAFPPELLPRRIVPPTK